MGTLFAALTARAGGLASNDSFVVLTSAEDPYTSDREFAREVARKAAEYRREIAVEWLGADLPPSVGRTYLSVLLTDAEDIGRTWPKNKITGEYNNVHLSTSPDRALGGSLAHEVAHVVMGTRFQGANRLPAWAEEGIASRYDDPDRIRTRREILQWYADTGNWPSLQDVLDAKQFPPRDRASYAVAESLTEFLLTRGQRKQFLEFAVSGRHDGWEHALSAHYEIQDTSELQALWERWANEAYLRGPESSLADEHREEGNY
jgi:hypothetical protein